MYKIYLFSSSISYSTLIFHNGNPTSYWGPQSLAEASPEARIRILNPPYLVLNTSSVVSNYSAPQTIATLGTVTDIRLVYGVLFPDVISLNFSMIVDPSVIQVTQSPSRFNHLNLIFCHFDSFFSPLEKALLIAQ